MYTEAIVPAVTLPPKHHFPQGRGNRELTAGSILWLEILMGKWMEGKTNPSPEERGGTSTHKTKPPY